MTSRGLQRPQDPRVFGAVIGAVGGTVFVLANRGALPDPLPVVALVVWLAVLGLWVAWVLVRPRTFPPLPQPGPRAGLVYAASVVGMLVVIQVAARTLTATDHADLTPAAVAAAVGLHFLPFARVFVAPVFWSLGLVLAVLGVGGVLLGLAGPDQAAPGAAVLAGLAMIGMVAADARS